MTPSPGTAFNNLSRRLDFGSIMSHPSMSDYTLKWRIVQVVPFPLHIPHSTGPPHPEELHIRHLFHFHPASDCRIDWTEHRSVQENPVFVSSSTVNAGWMKSPTAVTDLGDISGRRFCCCCLDYAMDEEIRQFQFTNRLPCKCPRNLSKSCFTCGHQL